METWRPWTSLFSNTCAKEILQTFFFFFLISYKTTGPSQRGHGRPAPRHGGPRGGGPMDEWLPALEEPSAPLASVRKGSGWRLCPAHPWLRGGKAAPGSLVLLAPAREGGRRGSEGRRRGWGQGGGRLGGAPQNLTENPRCCHTRMETLMMTTRIRRVTDKQMAIKTFFCRRGGGGMVGETLGGRGERAPPRAGEWVAVRSPSLPSSGSPGPS